MKIVLAVDPSPTGWRGFEAGLDLARRLQAEVHLVTAFADEPGGSAPVTKARREAERMLARAADKAAGLSVTSHALPEAPADALVRVAGEVGADFIVVGSKGTQGARRVLGSVATAVLKSAPCSVHVVHTT